MYLQDVTPTQSEVTKTEWMLRGLYRNLPLGLTAGDAEVNPMDRPWRYRIETELISEPVTQGLNIDPIETYGLVTPDRAAMTLGPIVITAQQEYEETIEQPTTREVLVATKNFATLDEIYVIQRAYADSVNSEIFRGYPAHHCEWRGVQTSDEILESGFTYYQAVIRITLGQKPAYFNALNVGWKWRDLSTNEGELINATDSKGQRVSEPVFLTAAGTNPEVGPVAQQDAVRYLLRLNLKDFNAIFV
jgi:hypothetical protein